MNNRREHDVEQHMEFGRHLGRIRLQRCQFPRATTGRKGSAISDTNQTVDQIAQR